MTLFVPSGLLADVPTMMKKLDTFADGLTTGMTLSSTVRKAYTSYTVLSCGDAVGIDVLAMGDSGRLCKVQ